MSNRIAEEWTLIIDYLLAIVKYEMNNLRGL